MGSGAGVASLFPRFNPTEHLWWPLKRKICELYPELEDQGFSEQVFDHLIGACKEAWEFN